MKRAENFNFIDKQTGHKVNVPLGSKLNKVVCSWMEDNGLDPTTVWIGRWIGVVEVDREAGQIRHEKLTPKGNICGAIHTNRELTSYPPLLAKYLGV